MAMFKVGEVGLTGALELKKLLETYPATVAEKAAKTGMKVAGKKLAEYFSAAAPKGPQGLLKRAMNVKRMKTKNKLNPRFKVGLQRIEGDAPEGSAPKIRYYYKTLELPSKRGPAMHPFFMRTWNAHKEEIAQIIVDSTRDALYAEAARIHRATLAKKR